VPANGPAEAVVVVSDHAPTLSELRRYFSDSGLSAVVATSVLPTADALAAEVGTLVLFPDGFPPAAIDEAIAGLRRRRRRLLLIVVTTTPHRFAAHDVDDGGLVRVVLPRPSFGWSIVDAIRTGGAKP